MNRIDLCKEKFEELFQSKQTLDPNDPILMTNLQRFIFGEVFYTGQLEDKMREMITCTVLTVLQTLPQLKAHAQAALNIGVTPKELKSIVYQCAPFIGYPRTLNALRIINEIFEERQIKQPVFETVDEDQRYEEGLKHQMPLYGNEIKDRYAFLPDGMNEALPRFLTEWCFTENYADDTLDVQTRELIILVILTVLNSTNQIVSHGLGNLKVGNSLATMYAALIQCLPYVGFPSVFNAINALRQLEDEK